MSNDRLTPKEIKAWCDKTYWKMLCDTDDYDRGMIIDLMVKAYKRGYQDALGG